MVIVVALRFNLCFWQGTVFMLSGVVEKEEHAFMQRHDLLDALLFLMLSTPSRPGPFRPLTDLEIIGYIKIRLQRC